MRYQHYWIPRAAQLGLVALWTVLLSFPSMPAHAQEDAANARVFFDTGYQIQDDAILEFFTRHGGPTTFGSPISREFTLSGAQIQLFERGALQVQPDGWVHALELAEPGFLPYTHLNGSTVPPVDPAWNASAPSLDRPDYGIRSVGFLRALVPDTWSGTPVRFFSTFTSMDSCDDAMAAQTCPGGAHELLGLAVWGSPTSAPTVDPNNPQFVYQRFQNGILQYDATNLTTQGVLLGEYLKELLTGQDLPADLAIDAAESPLMRQYDPSREHAVARPAILPRSDLTNAFVPDAD